MTSFVHSARRRRADRLRRGDAFLNASRAARRRGLPADGQWGAWQEVGMAVAALAPATHGVAFERVDHPLLQRRSTAPDGATVFRATLDSRTQWVLDEHRVRGAEPVLPGTGFVEMARAALFAAGFAPDGAAVELSDLSFSRR